MNSPTNPLETRLGAAQLFGQTLADLGVRHVFAIVGSHINPLLSGCEDAGIRIVDTRHEATAGHAVEGHAKTTGQPGVCIVTAGPGFTNVLTAMMSCFVEAAPAIFVAGASPLHNGGPNPLQGGFSQIDMARPVAKWVASAARADEIPALLRHGWSMATSGRPGPVFIEIPTDVAHGRASLPARDFAALPAAPAALPKASAADIERVIERLAAARHPILVAGGGVKYAGAHEALAHLAEAAGLPVLTNFDSHGALPAESPYWCGSLNLVSRLPVVGRCDLLLVLGARFGLLTGGIPGRFSNPELSIVQVDIHPGELEHLRPRDIGIAACCGDFLRRLNARLPATRSASRRDWLGAIHTARAAVHAAWRHETSRPGLMHPYHLARCLTENLPRGTIHVVDGGDTKHWIEMNFAPAEPGRYISRAYSGTLGSGQGLALGACFAHGDAPVCLIIGDGAWGFHLQEIDTYIRHGAPIVTVVVNNGAWASIRHIQERLWNDQRYIAVDLGFARYDRVAEGFACAARRVDTTEALAQALREAVASGKPWVIDAMTDCSPDPLAPPGCG